MSDDEIDRWLSVLGYSRPWLESGVLSVKHLEVQAQQWREAEADRNAEHYRYGMWRAYADEATYLSVEQIRSLLELDLHEARKAGTPMGSFGHAIAYDLLEHPALTLETLELLRAHPVSAQSFLRGLERVRQRLANSRDSD